MLLFVFCSLLLVCHRQSRSPLSMDRPPREPLPDFRVWRALPGPMPCHSSLKISKNILRWRGSPWPSVPCAVEIDVVCPRNKLSDQGGRIRKLFLTRTCVQKSFLGPQTKLDPRSGTLPEMFVQMCVQTKGIRLHLCLERNVLSGCLSRWMRWCVGVSRRSFRI